MPERAGSMLDERMDLTMCSGRGVVSFGEGVRESSEEVSIMDRSRGWALRCSMPPE